MKEDSVLTSQEISERNKLLESLGIIVCNNYKFEKEDNYILSHSLISDSSYSLPELIDIKNLNARDALNKVFRTIYDTAHKTGKLIGKNSLRQELKGLLEEEDVY